MTSSLQDLLDAFLNGDYPPGVFLSELSAYCDATPDSSWEVLALLDQYHRRGKLSANHFREFRRKIEFHALGIADPGSIVWDEVAAFWLVLWLVTPAGWVDQLLAFGLFRFFDAVKPGPVAWADQLFHDQARSGTANGWRLAGLGIMLDDLVAAACTLLVMALWRFA